MAIKASEMPKYLMKIELFLKIEVSKNFFLSNLGKSNLNILKCSMMASYVKIYTRKGNKIVRF